jgi:hypothetical protein
MSVGVMEDYKKRDLRVSHTLWTIYILVSNNTVSTKCIENP